MTGGAWRDNRGLGGIVSGGVVAGMRGPAKDECGLGGIVSGGVVAGMRGPAKDECGLGGIVSGGVMTGVRGPAGGGGVCTVCRPRRPARSEAGLSLLEAIVATGLTLAVVAGLYGAVRPALVLNRSLPGMADSQQRVRHAFDRLHADLMATGRGTTRVEPGPLSRMLPAVVPYLVGRRARDGEHRRVRPDAITVLAVSPGGGAETRLVDAVGGDAMESRLAPGPGCGRAACGHRVGDLVLVFDDRPAWGLFRVRAAGETTVQLDPSGPSAAAFEAGSVIAPIDVRHYYLDEERRQLRRYDGWRGDFPLIDGVGALEFRFFGISTAGGQSCEGAEPGTPQGRLEEIALVRFTDGPWCGPAWSPFDADLLRVRALGLDVRLEGAATGPASTPRTPPFGGATGYRAAFVVAPPNLQMAGTGALR